MTRRKNSQERLPQAVRADLAARLRARAPEIEKAILTRIRNMPEPIGDDDPAYVAGLRSAVAGAVSYGLDGVEKGGESSVSVPPETGRQARRAAREGVGLDTVLRRYAAGNKSLEEFIVAEAEGVPGLVLRQILSDQGPLIDRLMESVSAEYSDELERARRSSAQQQADRVVHLLRSNSLVGPTDLDYDFDVWHVGMILVGHNARKSTRAIVDRRGCRSLSVARDDETVWIWLGSAPRPVSADLESFLIDNTTSEVSVAIGEPRKGLDGWRQTHREAQMALQVVLYRPQRVTRCRDVILVSAVLRDQAVAMSLLETYLAPLDGRGDSGEALRNTLRAYFKADQNVASAAVVLGVARHTVERRLRNVEKKLGQTLDTCSPQLQVALGAEELFTSSSQTWQLSGA